MQEQHAGKETVRGLVRICGFWPRFFCFEVISLNTCQDKLLINNNERVKHGYKKIIDNIINCSSYFIFY